MIKRTLASGYAGVDNPVFFNPNTVMLFGDAKKVCEDLLTNVKKQFGEKYEGPRFLPPLCLTDSRFCFGDVAQTDRPALLTIVFVVEVS